MSHILFQMARFVTNSGDVADLACREEIILNYTKLYTENSWLKYMSFICILNYIFSLYSIILQKDDTQVCIYFICQVLTEAALLSF